MRFIKSGPTIKTDAAIQLWRFNDGRRFGLILFERGKWFFFGFYRPTIEASTQDGP